MLLLIQGCLTTWLLLREGEFNLPYRKKEKEAWLYLKEC